MRNALWRGSIALLFFISSCAPIATIESPQVTTTRSPLAPAPTSTQALFPITAPVAPSSNVTHRLTQATSNSTDEAILVRKLTLRAEYELTLTALPTSTPFPTLSREEIATRIKPIRDAAQIKLESKGQTFTYTISSRFFVFLDDEKYPVNSLRCEPDWVMGYISNGSIRGPGLYPVYYEAYRPGSCTLISNDFWVRIVVVDFPTVTPTRP